MKIIVGFVVMICCTVAANILMRLGAMSLAGQRMFGFVDWKTVVGLGAFGAAALIYAWILGFVPLNVAQSVLAAQYIAVILAAALLLSEPIPPGRWLGMVLISIGILVVAVTGNPTPID